MYDILGREVTTLIDGMRDAGYGSVEWDASNESGGVYFYRMIAGEFTQSHKLVLTK